MIVLCAWCGDFKRFRWCRPWFAVSHGICKACLQSLDFLERFTMKDYNAIGDSLLLASAVVKKMDAMAGNEKLAHGSACLAEINTIFRELTIRLNYDREQWERKR
jgi:hypothetical protein